MKISENTIGILRNFSDINANILFTLVRHYKQCLP